MSGQTLKETFDSDRTIIHYLLGESSPKEQKELEERYFSEPNFLEQVLAVEDDLIDAYVRHELTKNEREQFENYFQASPDRRERVETAKALLTRLAAARVSAHAPVVEAPLRKWAFFGLLGTERLPLRFAFSALLMVAVVGGLWLFVQNQRLRAQLGQAQAEKTQLQQREQQLQQQLAAREVENERLAQAQKLEAKASTGETSDQKPLPRASDTSAPVIVSFVLTPGLTRDFEGINKLVIPPGAQFVRLQLSIESRNEYKNYDASLQRVGAGEIWHRNRREHQPSTGNVPLIVKLPARLFTAGEYLLTLRGASATGQVDVIGDYSFTIVRERK